MGITRQSKKAPKQRRKTRQRRVAQKALITLAARLNAKIVAQGSLQEYNGVVAEFTAPNDREVRGRLIDDLVDAGRSLPAAIYVLNVAAAECIGAVPRSVPKQRSKGTGPRVLVAVLPRDTKLSRYRDQVRLQIAMLAAIGERS